jgi:tRNA threonylcarbamoyladenosine biosynthesis protein TsaE
MKKVIITNNSLQSEAAAARIGQNLRGGETIELISDLGGGKTTFTRGLVRGAGSKDHVSSPTFTISNIYKAPKFSICHFDFYRLPSAGIIEHSLHEAVDLNRDVTIVEWSDIVKHVLPKKRLTVRIRSTADEERMLEFTAPNSLSYLLDDVNTDN